MGTWRAGPRGRAYPDAARRLPFEGRDADAPGPFSERRCDGLVRQQSNERVAEGSTVVNAAGKTMEDTEAAIRRVNGLMQQIAEASVEQASGIGQVSQTITQMDSATQQNAALVEEATAAAKSMADQAAALADHTERFTLHEAAVEHGLPTRDHA